MSSPLDPKHKEVRQLIDFYANQYRLDPTVGYWQLWQESRFKKNAESPVGAKGIAQFMPATAARFGVNVNDLASSIEGWAKYMSLLYKEFGSYKLALAAYNAGEGNVRKYKGIPPFEETKNYVAIILKNKGGGIGLGLGVALAAVSYLIYLKTK